MRRGDLLTFMAVVAFAILFAELQVRREANSRYICLAITWIVATGMLVWLASG
jgi:uncharacterized protein with PQ loop repeat